MWKINLNNAICFFNILIVILLSGSLLSKIEPYALILNVISILFLTINILKINKDLLRNKIVLYIISFVLLLLSSMIVNFDYSAIVNYISISLMIILAGTIVILNDIDKIEKYYLDLILFLSFFSLIGYYFIDYFSFIKFELYFRDQLYNFYWLYGYIEGVDYRNFSIFIEPGLYQIYLSFAILIMILRKSNKYWYYFLLFFSLVTTNSTTGYILGLILFFGLLLSLIKNINLKVILLPCIVGVLLVIDTFLGVYENIDKKLNGVEKKSALDRLLSTKIDWEIFLENPILGVGLGKYINNMEGKGYYIEAATNTFTQILAILGICFFILFLYIILSTIFRLNMLNRFLIIMFFTLSYSSQPVLQYPFFYFSIFYLCYFSMYNKD